MSTMLIFSATGFKISNRRPVYVRMQASVCMFSSHFEWIFCPLTRIGAKARIRKVAGEEDRTVGGSYNHESVPLPLLYGAILTPRCASFPWFYDPNLLRPRHILRLFHVEQVPRHDVDEHLTVANDVVACRGIWVIRVQKQAQGYPAVVGRLLLHHFHVRLESGAVVVCQFAELLHDSSETLCGRGFGWPPEGWPDGLSPAHSWIAPGGLAPRGASGYLP